MSLYGRKRPSAAAIKAATNVVAAAKPKEKKPRAVRPPRVTKKSLLACLVLVMVERSGFQDLLLQRIRRAGTGILKEIFPKISWLNSEFQVAVAEELGGRENCNGQFFINVFWDLSVVAKQKVWQILDTKKFLCLPKHWDFFKEAISDPAVTLKVQDSFRLSLLFVSDRELLEFYKRSRAEKLEGHVIFLLEREVALRLLNAGSARAMMFFMEGDAWVQEKVLELCADRLALEDLPGLAYLKVGTTSCRKQVAKIIERIGLENLAKIADP